MLEAQKGLGNELSDSVIQASHTLQSSIAALKEAWSGLKNAFSGLIPIINWIVEKLTVAIAYVSAFLQGMFGTLAISSNLTDSASSYADSLSEASESAKEIKGTLSGFDELNNLTFNTTSATSDSDSLVSINTDEIGDISYMSESLANALAKVNEFREAFANAQAEYGPTISILTTLIGVIMVVIGLMSGVIPVAVAGAALAALGIGGIISNINQGNFSAWWQSIKESISNSGIGKALSNCWNGIKTQWDTITKDWDEADGDIGKFFALIGQDILYEINTVMSFLFGDKWDEFKLKVAGIWSQICEWVDNPSQFFEDVKQSVGTGIDNLNTKLFGEKWTDFKDKMANMWAYIDYWKENPEIFLQDLKDVIAEKIDELGQKIFGEKWANIKEKVGIVVNKFKEWKEKPGQFFIDLKEAFGKGIDRIKDKIKEKWNAIKQWFAEHVGKIFTSAYWDEKRKAIANGIVRVVNSLIVRVQNGVNNIISKFNNSGIVTFFNDKLGLNMNLSTISIPQLQYLAKGGIVNTATPAIIGEAGAEAVVPLENNTQWMEKLGEVIAKSLSAQSSDIIMNIDGRQVAKSTVNEIQKMNKRNGYNILMM